VEGAARFGARDARQYRPEPQRHAAYRPLYRSYLDLAENAALRMSMFLKGVFLN